MKPKTRTKYNDQRQLAQALDISPATVSRMISRPDWPFAKSPPWTQTDVVAIQRWRAAELREDRAKLEHGPDDRPKALKMHKLAQEIRNIKARADGAELELERQRGRLVSREEVERGRVERIEAVKAGMRGLIHTLPAKLVGLDAVAMERILEDAFRQLCNRFAQE